MATANFKVDERRGQSCKVGLLGGVAEILVHSWILGLDSSRSTSLGETQIWSDFDLVSVVLESSHGLSCVLTFPRRHLNYFLILPLLSHRVKFPSRIFAQSKSSCAQWLCVKGTEKASGGSLNT